MSTLSKYIGDTDVIARFRVRSYTLLFLLPQEVLDIFIHHRGGRNKQKKTVITITTIWKKEVT